jgi:polar amino acid transport system substrate-binding protein
MFLHRFVLKALILCVSSLYASTAFGEKVVVYAHEAYFPAVYLDHGKATGILPDIFTRLSKDTGDTYELVLVPWKRALQQSLNGKGGITSFSFTKERAILYDYSEPIYDDELQLVVLKGHEFVFREIVDLKGKTVGGNVGAVFGEKIDQAIADGMFKMERDEAHISRLLKLLHGRMDVAIMAGGAENIESLLVSNPELKEARSKFVVLPNPFAKDTLFLAFVKTMNMKPALARFNKALADLKKSKEYKQIILRHDRRM